MPVDRSIHGCGAWGKRRRTAPRSPPCSAGSDGSPAVIGTSAMFADLALIAVAIEALVGYPDALYRLIGHPVSWMGRLIAWCDESWNLPTLSFEEKRRRGVLTLLLLVLAAVVVGVVLTAVLTRLFPAWLALALGGVVGSSLLAQ